MVDFRTLQKKSDSASRFPKAYQSLHTREQTEPQNGSAACVCVIVDILVVFGKRKKCKGHKSVKSVSCQQFFLSPVFNQ